MIFTYCNFHSAQRMQLSATQSDSARLSIPMNLLPFTISNTFKFIPKASIFPANIYLIRGDICSNTIWNFYLSALMNSLRNRFSTEYPFFPKFLKIQHIFIKVGRDYASQFLMRNKESRNFMTMNSSQGKKTRKTRNWLVLKKGIYKAEIELSEKNNSKF